MSRVAWAAVVVVVLAGSEYVRAQPIFEAPRVWDDGRQFVAAGDLNGDMRADIVSVDSQGATLIISINDGQGGFNDLGAVAGSNFDGNKFGIGDVNGDGFNDLVMAHLLVTQVSVFAGSGTGTLGSPTSMSISGVATELFIGQANGDAISDILLHIDIGPSWQLQWFLGGAAGLTAGPALPTLAGPAGLKFAALDLQANGLTDLATFDDTNGSQLRTFVTVSGGGLVNGASLSTPTSFLPGTQVVAGDFLGNGIDDLAIVQPELVPFSSSQLRYLVFANSGLGNLSAQATQLTSMNALSVGQVFAGDWDNDGAADLMHYNGANPQSTFLIGGTGIELFANSGSGQFDFQWQVSYLAAFAEGVGMQDLDGDNRADLITSNSVTLSTASGNAPTDQEARQWQGRLLDADGDGDVDLVNRRQLQFSINDGRGFFPMGGELIQQLPSLPSTQAYVAEFITDLDGDGDLDGIFRLNDYGPPFFPGFPPQAIFNSYRTLINDQSGVFQDIGVTVAPSGPRMRLDISGVEWYQRPLAADFNGDGLLDIVTFDELWFGTAVGAFTQDPSSYWQQWIPLDLGDVDGDGDVDVLASRQNASQMQVAVHLNNGSGTFTPSILPAASPNDKAAALGDADDDGDLDVVVVGPFRIFENVGTGFSPVTLPEPSYFLPARVDFADLNGDGTTDLFFSGDAVAGTICRVLLSDGPGLSFAPFQSYSAYATLGLGDIDGDGDPDIVGRAQSLNRQRQNPFSGLRRQYGPATPGTNGQSPLFGVEGPMRVGETLTFNLRRITGGAQGVLSFGNQESDLPDFPFLGSNTLNFPWTTLIPLPTAPGTLGVMGQGNFSFQATMPPALLGTRVFLQTGFTDANAPSGVVFSNGLEVFIGQ